MRKIIHIDMDAFYASVEQRDNPDLRGKPLAVGGGEERGVVAAASYEARKFGVYSAMPSKTAKRLCPDLIFVKPRFDQYKSVSKQIREIFFEYTDLVEPLSLDEAYLDVTTNKKNLRSATLIASEIKKKIKQRTELTASAGVSINKFLAKTASDVNKPDGLFVIKPNEAVKYVETLPIKKFFGIGKVTAKKFQDMGVNSGYDLKQIPEMELVRKFGKVGRYYYRISRAEDNREVNPNRERKSVGAENTFSEDLKTLDQIKEQLDQICNTLATRIERSNSKGKTVTVKVKYNDFNVITRSKSTDHWINTYEEITDVYSSLLNSFEIRDGIRLLGLTLSNLYSEEQNDDHQLTLEF